MRRVHFTYNGLEGTVNCEDMKTKEQLHKQLCDLFSLNENVDFTGVKHYGSGRLYSLEEIVNCPSLFVDTPGSIIIGPLSPKSHKRTSTVIETIFKHIFSECNRHGLYRYLDYFVLRVLYNRKASYFTYAINLMLDNDMEALHHHLKALVFQMKDSTAVKMDILRLITLNMQMNKELTYQHVATLLSLISQEDGLICSAYNTFEENDDLGQLKNSLLRALLFFLKPERITQEERVSAQRQSLKNRGSWVRESSTIDINTVFEELSESEIVIYTLFELAIISELEASQLLQIVSEVPQSLHAFIQLVHSNKSELTNHVIYSLFLESHAGALSRNAHPLYYPFHMEEYPSNQITGHLLQLEKEGTINRIEYILLYKRCMMSSPVLRHCYSVLAKTKNAQVFAKNIRLCLTVYDTIQPTKMTHMNETDAMILEEIIIKKHLQEFELTWLLNEYNEGNEVVINAFSVCRQTGDIAGLLSVLHSIIQMYSVYQDEMEAKQFLTVLVKELIANETITNEQSEVLSVLIQEGNACLIELYKEYKRSSDFVGLLDALIYVSNSVSRLEEGEMCNEGEIFIEEEEMNNDDDINKEDELTLPSLDQALKVITNVEGEFPSSAAAGIKQMIREGNANVLSIIARYIRDGNLERFLNELYQCASS